MKILQKNELRDGYYYVGYADQHYTVISNDQQKIIGMWDENNDCFWFWEYEGNRKSKCKLRYLTDINNEIEIGFFPIKEIIPKEKYLINL
jgi:hypothetical protein